MNGQPTRSDSTVPLIAHVIFRLDVGGLENGLVNLINAIPPDRFRHAIICIDRSTDFRRRIRRDDVEVVEIHKKPGRDLGALRRIYRVLRNLRPDIVHTRNLGAMDALLPAVLAGVRHRIHGEHGWDVDDLKGLSRKNRLLRKLHAPMITQYVTVSADLRNYLIDRVGIRGDRIRHICNGVDTSRFASTIPKEAIKAELRERFGRDCCFFGTVGRVEPVKDPLNLVAAFAETVGAERGNEKARLVVVGDGVMQQAVADRLRAIDLHEMSWLTGRRDDVPALMQGLDVFIQASLAEGISNTVLEAMASGLPVIATDVGGNPELVEDGVTGIVVPPGDPAALARAMLTYLDNRSMREAHGLAGRKKALEAFSIETMVRNYMRLYDQVLHPVAATS